MCVYDLNEFTRVAIDRLVGRQPSYWLVMTSSMELHLRWPPTRRTARRPLSLVTDILVPILTFNQRMPIGVCWGLDLSFQDSVFNLAS